jgi:thymidylate synthase
MWSPGCYHLPRRRHGAVQPDLLQQALGGGKDVPCNTNAFFRVTNGKLDMMVNCRSNDIFWGAYGANAVHFSFLQEYVASSIGVEVGRYWQNSFNFHAYVDRFPKEKWPSTPPTRWRTTGTAGAMGRSPS